MLGKQERTLGKYMEAVAKMRLFKSPGGKMYCGISALLSAPDQDKLRWEMDKSDEACSCAEDNMFWGHPLLSGRRIDMFYGDVGKKTRGDVDKQVAKMAREVSDGLFAGKGY